MFSSLPDFFSSEEGKRQPGKGAKQAEARARRKNSSGVRRVFYGDWSSVRFGTKLLTLTLFCLPVTATEPHHLLAFKTFGERTVSYQGLNGVELRIFVSMRAVVDAQGCRLN